jgi:sterol desaturase/sphingolipid hydroxylase (fatty acid hydroxylase superfamily)
LTTHTNPENEGPEHGVVVSGRGPRRKRVVLAERRGARTVLRTIVELEEQTATGEALLAGLVRTQLRLAVGLMLLMAVSLGVLPLAFWLFPGFADWTLLGLRLPWVLLGGLSFPFLFGIGYWYCHRAEHNERAFVRSVEN